ncbi:flavin reductase [Arthrobacter ginkgonis]|uniref:Flavin reductase n=1 Tax=Arthrobacter ginkgonis TaxID=1630594 RepID=A0ABP7DBN1_9MICC
MAPSRGTALKGNAPLADQATARSINGDTFRKVMGNYPTGVVVVTATDAAGEPVGMVIGSFTSVSLDPPLVAFLPTKASRTFERMRSATSFCINVLAADQEWLCRHFSAPKEDKFQGVAWHPSPSGAPILDGAVSWIECVPHEVFDGGDHHLVLARVTDLEASRDSLPLLFFQRGYGKFTPSSLVVSNGREFIESVHLAAVARPEMELIASSLGVECSLACVSGSDYVFVASCNRSESAGRSRLGARVPLMPPFGGLMVGEAGGPTDEQWLARLGTTEGEAVEAARAQLARVRERGWSLALFGGATQDELDELVKTYMDERRTPAQEQAFIDAVSRTRDYHEPAEIDPDAAYDVIHLAVPVHGLDGNVKAVLRLGELPRGARWAEIDGWLDRMRETVNAIELRIARGLS